MTDVYRTFRELQEKEVLDRDWDREYHCTGSPILVMAPHGGAIEPFTSELAQAIAGEDLSWYTFRGLKAQGNRRLHITSHRFDEPLALEAVSRASAVLAIHGEKSLHGSFIMLGGLWEELKARLGPELERSGFSLRRPGPGLAGTNPRNICNRGRMGAGGQIELSAGLRRELKEDPERFRLFTSVVRRTLKDLEPSTMIRKGQSVGPPTVPGAGSYSRAGISDGTVPPRPQERSPDNER